MLPRLSMLGDMGLKQSAEPEWLDGYQCSASILAQNLQDIARINRYLGGTRLTLHSVERISKRVDPTANLTILDVGTGLADIPVAICEWGQRGGRAISVTAADRNPAVLALARQRAACWPNIKLVQADVANFHYPPRSFDIVLSSLFLHHLSRDDAVESLRIMGKLARKAVIVNDLLRHRPGYIVSRLLLPAATNNVLTRHDGPLSIRRAYTAQELLTLMRTAGLVIECIDQFLFYRVAITATPGAEPSGAHDGP